MLGEKNIAITNAASAIPHDTANPTCERIVFPAGIVGPSAVAKRQPSRCQETQR